MYPVIDPMLQPVSYRDWRFVVDPDRTRAGYSAQEAPDFASCCDTCENFGRAIECGRVFPSEVLELFEQLGIDPLKTVEQTEWDEIRPGWHMHSGWYHFVGELQNGPDAHVPTGENGWSVNLTPITPEFSVGFTRRVALVPAELREEPVVQLEFMAEIPWLLSEPPYQRAPTGGE